jgi:Bacterial Ig-like domain (group 2)
MRRHRPTTDHRCSTGFCREGVGLIATFFVTPVARLTITRYDQEERMRLVALVVVASLIGLAACGNKNPAAPSQPAITVNGLAISGHDSVLTGLSASYTVTATLSDGSTATVTPAWTSNNPTVASVDSGGRLEGRSHGSTSVTAAYEGRSTSKNVQVVNNYSGVWEGTSVARACTDSGELTNYDGGWCRSGWAHVGNVIKGPTMTLVQSGTNLSEITGRFSYFEEPISGMVTSDGRLTLSGTFTDRDWWENPANILDALQITAWDSHLSAPGVMAGRWSEHLVSLYPRRGEGDVDFEIITMTRTATTAAVSQAVMWRNIVGSAQSHR